jgi:hypothetical protein
LNVRNRDNPKQERDSSSANVNGICELFLSKYATFSIQIFGIRRHRGVYRIYGDDAGNDYPEIDSVESKQANNKQQWQLQHLTNY